AGHRGIVVVVAAMDPHQTLSTATFDLATSQLSARITAYRGALHCGRRRIRLMLIEAADASQGEEASVWGTGVPAGLKPPGTAPHSW
ncbi:hypothetical protein ELJ63_30275, partial [Klebsiella pneumoniae]|nr:hypothetical protein [Klebsiella pneumoniae]